MIVYTNLIPARYDGLTCWPFILIRPSRRDDHGLREHELVHHRRQAWITPIWFLRYWLSKSFRLQEEAIAYRTSVAFGMPQEEAIKWLMTYGALYVEAKELLK